ncbi:CBS domain-containing protein [Pseudanabaena sp. PCC 6802]|uniref:CBS domain-containing protein n=1 Tax=Pseudanabaena sp. PCC 6802 TaxID=118173 RepID=UPI0003498B51|nr:CBS domain-containing protein [Pseudanabaena sp. PCC 6802]
MQTQDSLVSTLTLEEVVDRYPLTVAADTSLLEAIDLMDITRGRSCLLSDVNSPSNELFKCETRASCVLVLQGERLIGIFTERDIVRFTAAGIDFEGVKVADVMTQPVITLHQSQCQDIFAILFLFRRYQIRHLPIVSDGDRLVAVVTPESIRQVLRPANFLKLRRVSDVMTREIIHASINASVMVLVRCMAKFCVSCVVITTADDEDSVRPVGIVTERDIVQFLSLKLDLTNVLAGDVMSTPLFLLNPDDSLWTAHQEMQRRHVRRLVVSWNWGRELGIVTQTSLLKVFDPMEMYGVIETLQRRIDELEAEKERYLPSSHTKPKPQEAVGNL